MKHYLLTLTAGLTLAGIALCACTKEPAQTQSPNTGAMETRAYADRSPVVQASCEINDTNPLNALSYLRSDNGRPLVGIVQLFAANIHKDANGDPTIYFNDKLAPLMDEAHRSVIAPLRAAGIKVLLTIMGDWQGTGVANLTDAQAEKLAAILAYIVYECGIDGIHFDDEYANYLSSLVSGSFGNLITKLRAKLGPDKLINVFQGGNYGSAQIPAAAGAFIDFADPYISGPTAFSTASNIQGVTNDRWMPMAINLGSSYTLYLTTIKNNAARVASQGYGGIMIRGVVKASRINPLPVLNAIAEGLYGTTVTYTGTEYDRDWILDPAGRTITYADAVGY